MELPEVFELDSLPTPEYEVIPAGNYTAMIAAAEARQNKSGTGHYLSVQYMILGPTHQGRSVFSKHHAVAPERNRDANRAGTAKRAYARGRRVALFQYRTNRWAAAENQGRRARRRKVRRKQRRERLEAAGRRATSVFANAAVPVRARPGVRPAASARQRRNAASAQPPAVGGQVTSKTKRLRVIPLEAVSCGKGETTWTTCNPL
jgi:hypothetical protein